ncbi:hypothetical protein NA57DRAFT_76208 [Rhizodiscina lignyota]|uniref:YTH domain-containing protein n=1 Tax=Rhizodiscina lignyota TaxID=1504668 RepID=A0A9P4IGW6_9PEZI|nr:hypothetical protein NA57DRAFT_76208 [Rhizodiscina lignyota]
MTSPADRDNTDEHWLEDIWEGAFTLDWICFNELPFSKVKHVPISQRKPGFRAISCFDGTEVSAPSAFELLKAFSDEESETLSTLPGAASSAQTTRP